MGKAPGNSMESSPIPKSPGHWQARTPVSGTAPGRQAARGEASALPQATRPDGSPGGVEGAGRSSPRFASPLRSVRAPGGRQGVACLGDGEWSRGGCLRIAGRAVRCGGGGQRCRRRSAAGPPAAGRLPRWRARGGSGRGGTRRRATGLLRGEDWTPQVAQPSPALGRRPNGDYFPAATLLPDDPGRRSRPGSHPGRALGPVLRRILGRARRRPGTPRNPSSAP